MKGKDLSSIQEREGRSSEFHGRSAGEGLYQTLKVTSNVASIFRWQKRWE